MEMDKDHDMVGHGCGFDYECGLWIAYRDWTWISDFVWIRDDLAHARIH